MINLLPPDMKESYHFAYRNFRLLRWVAALLFGLIGLGVIGTAGLIYMKQTTEGYTRQIQTAEASLAKQDLSSVQSQVKNISGDVQLAVQVLSKEVLFSKLLGQLATVMPNNAVLTDLTITQAQTTVTIAADTTDYTAATQLQVNLADPNNKIFSHADIVSIICTPNAPAGSLQAHYPCAVTIRALFATNNPFLFINNTERS